MDELVERAGKAVARRDIHLPQGRQGELQQRQARGRVEDAQGGPHRGQFVRSGGTGVLGDEGLLLVARGAIAIEQQPVDERGGGRRVAGRFAQRVPEWTRAAAGRDGNARRSERRCPPRCGRVGTGPAP